MAESTSVINEFYRNKTIFITGGTGFVGSCLLEKLLFATEFRKIYLLIRPKKGVSIQERLNTVLNRVLFTFRVKDILEQKRHLIEPIEGDICFPELGVSEEDRMKLTSEVEIVIHSAASVRFNNSLTDSFNFNVKGTQRMLNLVKECSNLKSFIYVSTDFTHSGLSDVLEETRRPLAITYKKLIELQEDYPEDVFNSEIWEKIKGKHPNTYCFTKCISESIVFEECDRLNIPYAIAKPSSIFAAAREPVRGYIELADQVLAGFMIGVGVGLIQVLEADLNNHLPGCTVDAVVNSILTMAWKVSCTYYPPGSDERVFAIHGSNYKAEFFFGVSKGLFDKSPSNHAIGLPMVKYPIKSPFLFKIMWFLHCTVFAWFVDMGLRIAGKKPQLGKVYQKALKMFDSIKFFSQTDWKMEGNRIYEMHESLTPVDKKLYRVDEPEDIPLYFTDAWISLKTHVLKEKPEHLPQAKLRLKILQGLDVAVKAGFFIILAYVVYKFRVIV